MIIFLVKGIRVVCKVVGWIQWAQHKDQNQAVVRTAMNLRKVSWPTEWLSFSRRILRINGFSDFVHRPIF
jgi:hypothetical protein